MTGVIPRGAQVRRVTGSRETPYSSQKTMTALRRRAFLPDPRPVALHPPLDGSLVALDGPTGGALQPPAQPAAQQLQHMTGVAGDPGLGAAGGEQLAGLETDTFEGLAVTQTTGVAAVSGWSHAAMLPGQPRSCHRKGRTRLSGGPMALILV